MNFSLVHSNRGIRYGEMRLVSQRGRCRYSMHELDAFRKRCGMEKV